MLGREGITDMSKTAGSRCYRSPVIALLIAALTLAPLGSAALAQDDGATLVGTFVDEALQPAAGIQAVLLDVSTNTRYTSEPSDASGTWSIDVPPGGRFQIVGMIKDGGPEQPVLNSPIRAVRVPGTYEFAPVVFKAVPVAEQAAPPAEDEDEEDAVPPYRQPKPAKTPKAGKPAWKKPGAVVGYVLGGGVLAYILLDDDDDGGTQSPVQP